ncbi:S4 domain-containing protein, partial [Limosilactobacillus reuteri]|uniref:S4 domain-containing protein n=1 Tax=Limosilactobacillus reuteri TaxID=1598 RepID=UPI0021F08809
LLSLRDSDSDSLHYSSCLFFYNAPPPTDIYTLHEPSRRQARQDVSSGAIRINGEKVDDVDAEIDPRQELVEQKKKKKKRQNDRWREKSTQQTNR